MGSAIMDDKDYMRRSIDLGRKNPGSPIGCVIVLGDEIVGEGHNEVDESNDSTAEAKRDDGVLEDPGSVGIHGAIDCDFDGRFGEPEGLLAVRRPSSPMPSGWIGKPRRDQRE
jgi:hypothetical protein